MPHVPAFEPRPLTPADEAPEAVDVSVVMPCLNEAATLAACIDRARAGLARLGRPGEIVVADNGSTDGSADIARAHGARVVHVPQRGYGAAYRGGLAAARGRIIVMGDSDDTYDFSRLDALVERVEAGADLVLGSRLRGTIEPGAMPWLHRYVGNPLLSATLNLFYRTRISDTHSGLRAFRRDAYEGLGLRATGMEFASEMLIAAARARWRIVEIPIAYRPRAGESKLQTFRDGWRHLRLLLLYSPTHLFTVPGTTMLVLGLVLLAALVRGPVTIAGRMVDFHFMFVGSLLASLGTQVLLLGVFAKSGGDLPSWFTLERGLIAGALAVAAGLAINVGILLHWIATGFGPLFAIRLAIVALTLLVVGTQVLFSSFYLDLLRAAREAAPVPSAADVPDAAARRR
jgi:glycosyltransferase involved in cell wall biosynthesis